MNILGISAFYHDSAAALIVSGKIIAAAQEERFTRKKHDFQFPEKSISYCLKESGLDYSDLDYVVFYDKPFVKFERLLQTYIQYAPKGFSSFIKAMPLWLNSKLWMKGIIEKKMKGFDGKVLFPEHHLSHASSAFFPSPYQNAAIITADGVGEWTTASIGKGNGNQIEILEEIHFPHSLGMLYSAFTYYTGFRVNSGEYKVMGLAPYGEPKYVDLILKHLIDIKEDGSFRLNMKYFNYAAGLTMTNKHFDKLFGGPPRKSESELSQKEMDLARSVQEVTEIVMLKMARHAKEITGSDYLCLSGGVALNSVANGKILREEIFKDIFIQPAAGDAGGALGAALAAWHDYLGNERTADGINDSQMGSYLGPEFSNNQIKEFLEKNSLPYSEISESKIYSHTAELLNSQNVVGWFQGRMEFGPRALGSRSILGDARSPEMQKKMNLKIKYRESFRPFAPSVLAEDVSEYFQIDRGSPYMLIITDVQKDRIKTMSEDQDKLFGIDKLNIVRSDIPAVTHVDYSARLQTVHKDTNPKYWELLNEYKKLTGYSVIVNTSFNVRGEPIVNTPQDAYKCFMRTEMDYLVMGNYVLDKNNQPEFHDQIDWKQTFELD